MHDFTTDIISELQLVIGFARSGEYYQSAIAPGVRFKEGYFSRFAMFWLYGEAGYLHTQNQDELVQCREDKSEKQQLLIALANICIEIDQHEKTDGVGVKEVLAERNRQVSRNRTIARDKYLYKGDELKRFSMHRLTGELRYYPLDNPNWSNVIKKHSFLVNLVQAGALIIAHIQKEMMPSVDPVAISQYLSKNESKLSPSQGECPTGEGVGGGAAGGVAPEVAKTTAL